MAYFGCDQSQVQRYLSGRTLTESRLSLLFNAFLKVPMQFLILLTGVLVFVFFHFHETPLLWNSVELARLERKAPAGGARAGAAGGSARPTPRGRAAAVGVRRRAPRRGGRGSPRAPPTSRRRNGSARPSATCARSRRGSRARRSTTSTTSSRATSSRGCRGGLAGLVLAVIFAAAMSALAGELNSLATATMVDFYQRFVRPGRERVARPARVACLHRVLGRVRGGVSPRAPGSSARRSRS